ncbi:hypothetical protein [Massilia sp. METH4]
MESIATMAGTHRNVGIFPILVAFVLIVADREISLMKQRLKAAMWMN